MKVTGSGGLSQTTGPKAARGGSGEGFRIVTPQPAAGAGQTTSVAGPSGVMGLAAMIALQDVGSPLERRRRSVGRAGRILDVLDGVKLALLGGELSGANLDGLRRVVREERAGTDDPKLEALLDEIETRAEVELAKLEVAGRAA